MYDGARALVQWDYYSFVLNINRPQFDGYEGQRKIAKICEVRAQAMIVEWMSANIS
jgi:hypothetical protein